MIVIRSDKEDAKEKVEKRKIRSIIPFIKLVVTFLVLFILIPIGITLLLHLPWYLSFIYPYGIVIGILLIITAVWTIYKGIKDLKLTYSASGYENEDELVTTGIYGYTRNPMYFGATILILGWFLVLPFTFILISSVLFLFLFYFTAKSEENQLTQKFGKKYLIYKRKVPLFIPYPRSYKK
jgi:protein-S-isoprenylcysteine O-methyltransferase Ste14